MKKRLTKEEFIIENKFKKEIISKEYDSSELKRNSGCKTDTLWCSIDKMIAFCNKAKKELAGKENVEFYQNWTDYEECEVELYYDDLETDEEFNNRVDKQYSQYLTEYNIELQKEKDNEYKKKLNKLNKQYGKEVY